MRASEWTVATVHSIAVPSLNAAKAPSIHPSAIPTLLSSSQHGLDERVATHSFIFHSVDEHELAARGH